MPDIPRYFHRIWLGSPMPEAYDAYWKKWKELHPGWELITWGEDDCMWLTNWELFDAAPTYAEKADIARYELLHRYGGVYVDADFEPLKNIEPLLEGIPGFSAWEDEQHIAIGIMGCEPGLPFFGEVVKRLPFNVISYENAPTNRRTGPLFFTELWQEVGGIYVFPPETFYPYHYTEEDPGTYPDTAYAVHHWTGSWQ